MIWDIEEIKKYSWVIIGIVVLAIILYMFLKEIIRNLVSAIFDFFKKYIPKFFIKIYHFIVWTFKSILYFIKSFFIALKICILGA